MIYFIDVNGVTQTIDDNGNASIPYKCIVQDDRVVVVDSDGFVMEEYTRYNSLEEINIGIDIEIVDLLKKTYEKIATESKPLDSEYARIISENIQELF